MSPKYRAVVFDAVGTLIHAEPSVAQVYAEVGRKHGSRLDAEEIKRRFQVSFARQEGLDRAAAWATNETREMRRWRDIVDEVFDDGTDRDSCFAELYDVFGQATAWRTDADADSLLPTLRSQGVILAMASNFDHRLHDVVTGLPALQGLHHVIVSSEVGTRKPGREFFAAMLSILGVDTTEVLFVGDDPENDERGAKEAGLATLLLDGEGKREGTIKRLADVLTQCRLR